MCAAVEMNDVQLNIPTRMSLRSIKFLSQEVAEEYIQYFTFKIFKTKQYVPQNVYICGSTIENRKGVMKTKIQKNSGGGRKWGWGKSRDEFLRC